MFLPLLLSCLFRSLAPQGRRCAALGACLLWAPAALALSVAPLAPHRPPPLVRVQGAEREIRLSHVRLHGEVDGSLATTVLELEFTNPNPRVLEGELRLPLHDGQTVSGFALEMADGTLMPAVPVPKAKGREVFESVIRRRVDPALLEQTEGQQFRLRLYPLNPGKPRKVSITLSEVLGRDAHQHQHLDLPLDFGSTVAEQLDLHLRLPGLAPAALQLGSALEGAALRTQNGQVELDLHQDGAPAPRAGASVMPSDARAWSLAWPAAAGDSVFSARHDGQAYFLAEINVHGQSRPRARPDALTVVWDASGSGAARDHAREFALLDAVFHWQPNLRVDLAVVRERADPVQPFEVRHGDWHRLRAALEQLSYDGASDAGLWTAAADQAAPRGLTLLFSDGLGNWGAAPVRAPSAGSATAAAAFAILASPQANPGWLRHWSEQHGGALLDLAHLDSQAALAELMRDPPRLERVEGEGFDQWTAVSTRVCDGRLSIAAHLTDTQAHAVLVLLSPEGREYRQEFAVRGPPAAAEDALPVAARRWAELRIAELEAEPGLHRNEIRRLGEDFGLLSHETSLIVLETLADYRRFAITPPAGPWRAAYLAEQGALAQSAAQQRAQHRQDLVRRYQDYQQWWESGIPKPAVPALIGMPADGRAAPTFRAMTPPSAAEAKARVEGASPAPSPRAAPLAAQSLQVDRLTMSMAATATAAPVTAGPVAGATEADPGARPTAAIDIDIPVGAPGKEQQQRLEAAADAERYAVYLDARQGLERSAAFYLDAAEVFARHGQHDLAVRVLSNLAEIDAENRDLLRVLAYRLQSLDEGEEALRVLRRVTELAPDEPQSWRDLGLAEAARGAFQPAVDALWKTAAEVWPDRFGDIDLIALTELDAIAALHPEVSLAAVDPALRRNLPLDLRVALSWDADDTDVDLWVQEPGGEWVNYAHRLSAQGGLVSRDCTQGYGPEVYALRHARPGHYEVRAHYYGSARQRAGGYPTLMLRLTRGFGTRGESSREVVLRLENIKDEVLVGSFDVAASAPDR